MSFEDIAAEVNAALQEVAQETGSGDLTGTITRAGSVTGPSYAPVYGNPTEHTFNIMIGKYSERERAGTLIKDTDSKVTAGVSTVEPEKGDVMVINGFDYRIEGVDALRPAGHALKYTLWTRKTGANDT